MSSLHTKYRPNTFDEVIGQDQAVKGLEKAVKNKRAHTYLFTGPPGTGKTTLARILANSLAGGQTNATNIEEFPASEKSGKEDVKAVINRTHYRALGDSPVKSIIIDECHRLSAAAWDALLKPLEEPHSHVYWMLCTTEPAKVPKAVLTRCLRYDLKLVSEENLFKLLEEVAAQEELKVHDDILTAIAENCGGSPRQALVYLEACQYCETEAEALKVMQQAGQSKEIVDLCRFLLDGRGRWQDAIKLIKAMDNVEAESCRIVINNYVAAVLLNTKDEDKATRLLGILECFNTPYNSSDKMAPLLTSVGMALNMDR